MQHVFQTPRITPAETGLYQVQNVSVDVLRLDEMHPVISGNKWFKLQGYLKEAQVQQKRALLTFGGAYSNHIIATAAAGALHEFQTIGIIRGERPPVLSPTLLDAARYGMQLTFTTRAGYKLKTIPPEAYGLLKKLDVYVIDEGGRGAPGVQGSMGILKSCDTKTYSHIVAAAGTGTMLAGLALSAQPHQKVIGISVLKNHVSLAGEVCSLMGNVESSVVIVHDYHFGGYAKYTTGLIRFMNDWYAQTGIPTDIVYTGKTVFAVDSLIQTGFFPPGSSVLLIHSGGLQGNRSLPAGTLQF